MYLNRPDAIPASGIFHSFVTCNEAQPLWDTFLRPWKTLGRDDSSTIAPHLLGMKLSSVPPGVWAIIKKYGHSPPKRWELSLTGCINNFGGLGYYGRFKRYGGDGAGANPLTCIITDNVPPIAALETPPRSHQITHQQKYAHSQSRALHQAALLLIMALYMQPRQTRKITRATVVYW